LGTGKFVNTKMPTERRESSHELDELLLRLKQGDLSVLDKVTRENVIVLLDRADGDDKIVKLLQQKL
jgi:BMFP domain-containing protein YqiC